MKKTVWSVLVVALCLVAFACTTTKSTTLVERKIESTPPNADVYKTQNGTTAKVGTTPLTTKVEYNETTYTNYGFTLGMIASGAAVYTGYRLLTEGGDELIAPGAIACTYGGLGLLLLTVLTGSVADTYFQKTVMEPTPLHTYSMAHDGNNDMNITEYLKYNDDEDEPVRISMEPAWYLRYNIANTAELNNPKSIPNLIQALADENRNTRIAAIKALAKTGAGDARVVNSLNQLVNLEEDAFVKQEIKQTLKKIQFFTMSGQQVENALAGTIIAVFDIQDATQRLSESDLEQLSIALSTALVQAAGVKLVARDQLREKLAEEKGKAYKACYDERCQITLGKALAAEKAVGTQILRIGNKCVIGSNLFDLKTETTERGVIVDSACEPEELLGSMKKVAEDLAGKNQEK